MLRPVLVCLHGGGFIRGDKAALANAGWYFARQGFVTVLPKTAWRPTAAGPAGPRTWRRCWPGCSATQQAMAAMPGAWC